MRFQFAKPNVVSKFVACLALALAMGEAATADELAPPIIPVGDDAYLQWDRLPYQRIGVRAYMRSTYDRQGNNHEADAGHFLYQEADDFNVALDTAGPGVLYFVRTNHHHGSPWRYEIDGDELVVTETATENPVGANQRLKSSQFMPQRLFPHPLAWTWPTTKGADLMWRPIPFAESFRLAYSRTFYGTGYFIYHQFARGTEHLSREINSWDRQPPDPRVLELLHYAGRDIAPRGEGVAKASGSVSLAAGHTAALEAAGEGPLMLRALKLSAPAHLAERLGDCRLRVTWDDRWEASIDAPLDLFFGAGRLHNADDREWLVRGLPLSVRYAEGRVHLASYWPMPYFKSARIELVNRTGEPIDDLAWEIRTVPFDDPPAHVGYFHATYSDHPKPVMGRDVVFLDTDEQEGGGPWSGSFVGMTWIFSEDGNLTTLEGDPRFFFDDSRTPQAMGTGTEEWGGGGDYWGGRNMTTPLAGHPVGREKGKHRSPAELTNAAYRFLIADHFPFGRRAVIGLEHGGGNTSTEHYSGVVYWYGSPTATLELTDELNVCHEHDAKRHNVETTGAEPCYELTSRYEWGPDSDAPGWWHEGHVAGAGARLYYPAERDTVRSVRGSSQFTVTLDSDNHGVMLRRKFDYHHANQRGRVSVRPAGADATWQEVGDWYTAGSNTCVHSRPGGANFSEAELAHTEHHIMTSNRRWREEEFLLPASATRGVSRLEVRIENVPVDRPLFPGHPFPSPAVWSESRYWVYCYKLSE